MMARMSDIIYPRSPREEMCGWVHLPRFIDKIRLHLAGKLAPDYRDNFTKGFDGKWLAAAGVEAAKFIEVVRNSITDGEVCDWVRKNVTKTEAEKAAFRESVLDFPRPDDEPMQARLKSRKEESGLGRRDDIKSFVDYIDADEGRL
jgi:gluconokinase